MKSRNFSIVIIVALSAILYACSGTSTDNGSDSNVEKDTVVAEEAPVDEDGMNEELIGRFELLMINLPLPIEILTELSESGAEFSIEELEHIGKASDFVNDFEKSLNLGFYGSDLSYAARYERQDDAMKYLSIVKDLVDDLGISEAVDPETLARFEANQASPDSLTDLAFETYNKIGNIFKDNGDIEKAVLITTGSRIEGLYLSCIYFPAGVEKENVEKLRTRIRQEGFALPEAIGLLKEFKSDFMVEFATELNKIEEFYGSITDPSVITDDEIKQLGEILTSIRGKYTAE